MTILSLNCHSSALCVNLALIIVGGKVKLTFSRLSFHREESMLILISLIVSDKNLLVLLIVLMIFFDYIFKNVEWKLV